MAFDPGSVPGPSTAPITSVFTSTRAPRSRSRAEMSQRAALIAGCVNYIGLPVRRILDAGCGLWAAARAAAPAFPARELCRTRAERVFVPALRLGAGTIEAMPYARALRSRHLLRRAAVPRPSRSPACDPAPRARLPRSALLRRADARGLADNCDRRAPTACLACAPRAGTVASSARHFIELGCGMWLRRDAPITLWAMDRAGPRLVNDERHPRAFRRTRRRPPPEDRDALAARRRRGRRRARRRMSGS